MVHVQEDMKGGWYDDRSRKGQSVELVHDIIELYLNNNKVNL